jgi:proteasome lid subunit RPN8/RPN11
MLVALKTCTVKGEGGAPERLVAGKSWVDQHHFLVRTYPGLFGLGVTRSRPSRSAALPAARAAPKPAGWKPLVRHNPGAPAEFTVTLYRNARTLMAELAFLARGEHETGGALFGPPAKRSSGKGEVRIAGEPGPAARSWRSAIKPDLEHIRREAAALERSGSDLRWVGHWHTHPGGNGEPSKPDLEFFAADCREQTLHGHPLEHYVALILTPRRDWHRHDHEPYMSWVKPELHAWHMRQLSDDEFTCQRAIVADDKGRGR